MTWYWDISNLGTDSQTLRVWDHTSTEVYSETKTSWEWNGEYPDEVLDAMNTNLDNGLSLYNQTTLIDAATENIQRGSPP